MTDINKALREIIDEDIIQPIFYGEGVDPKSYFGIDADELVAKIKALVVESLVDGKQISSYHDLYSGKGKEWTDGYRSGFDMCKGLVLALWK